MAISREERNKRLQVIHVMRNILGRDIPNGDISPIREASGNTIIDLDELEKFLDGKTLPYYEGESLDRGRDINVDILFMSTKDVKIEPDDNLVRFNIYLEEDEASVFSDSDRSCTLEKFMGLPKKVSSPDFKSVKEVVNLCDVYSMYNVYSKEALDIVRMRMPSAYNMFTGRSLLKRVDESSDATLWVAYDKRFRKFIYAYNPGFILTCALDEWSLNRKRYTSLKGCYCYVLAFLITHEMMHIIHHNTTSTIDMEYAADVETTEGHKVVNIMQDSFINCEISKVFNGVRGLNGYSAPMPRVGVGDEISVRAEHNKGFKGYRSLRALASHMLDVISETTKNKEIGSKYADYRGIDSRDISKFKGADVFIRVVVNKDNSMIRSNSGIYQKVVNDLIKTITDGKVYDRATQLTSDEKETDKGILPNGSLVRVKGTSTVCSVLSYDKTSKMYDLMRNEVSGVSRKKDKNTGADICTSIYTPTKHFGTRRRKQIVPFSPEENSWVEDNGTRKKKDKLSEEDMKSMGMPGMGQSDGEAPPVFHVGDVVWVKATRKFGKIVSINNGKFKLEEMEEVGVRVLDDSDYHNTSGEGV